MEGSIVSVQKRPVSITQEEVTQEYELQVNVRAECKNTHTNKPLWSGTINKNIPLEGDAVGAEIDAAILEALDQIAEDIVNKTIAAW